MEQKNPLENLRDEDVQRAPRFNVSNFNIVGTGAGVTLLCSDQIIRVVEDGAFEAAAQPVLQMNMSTSTAKELATVLTMVVAQFESEFGEINSPFLATLRQKV